MSGDHRIVRGASKPARSKAPTWEQELEDAWKFRRTKDCSKALKLIKPASERRAQCENAIDCAVRAVRISKALDKYPSAAALRKRFRTYAKTLRAVEIAGRGLAPYKSVREQGPSFMDQVRSQREEYEKLANRIPVRSGSRRRSAAKQVATHLAYELLAQYGSGRAPGLTLEGPWHQLARILFEHADADLFDYLRNYHLWRARLQSISPDLDAWLTNPLNHSVWLRP